PTSAKAGKSNAAKNRLCGVPSQVGRTERSAVPASSVWPHVPAFPLANAASLRYSIRLTDLVPFLFHRLQEAGIRVKD
ncbi:MAG: hypothetical protein JJ992_23510, partial [Planctomycetes bacterium]|nr:hypothetical protein [Planctomycetota bacterium]